MKNLSREAIKRMTGAQGSTTTIGGSGGGDMAGYATQLWTDENYVGKDFFRSLFKAYDANGNEVLPNDTTTTIDNIKAMFGFWTDFYISALGTGGQSTVGLRLAQLADVNVAGVTNGQVLTYNSTTGKWVAITPQSGTDMATVWANLAANGNQQINASHLTTALTGYATQTWVNSQISDMATKTWVNSQISDMATQTWVGQNYLSKTDAASTYLSIAFFNRLFKAYNGTTQVYPNNTTTAIDNIKAMFGFWTEFYVSALGTGGQSTVGLRLAQLADVNVAGVTNGQVLTYDTTTGKWIASTPQSGTDMATVWANLAAVDNTKQIDGSHLTTALTGYATQTWVGQQGYITSSAISDMATKTWVSQNYLPLTGGEVTGTLVLSKTQDASESADNGPALVIGGTRSQAHIEIDNNEILAKSGGTGITTLYLQDNGGEVVISGDLTVNGGDLTVNEPNARGASAIWFQSGGTTYGNLRVKASNGEFYFYNGTTGDGQSSVWVNAGGFYAYGQVVALSDARHKRVIGDTGLTVEHIAGAPAIRFTWKDRDDKTVFVGSIAQYWQKVLPEVVQSQADGTLSLDYQVTALISSIVVARKVMNHESRLQRLEKMFAINEDDIED